MLVCGGLYGFVSIAFGCSGSTVLRSPRQPQHTSQQGRLQVCERFARCSCPPSFSSGLRVAKGLMARGRTNLRACNFPRLVVVAGTHQGRGWFVQYLAGGRASGGPFELRALCTSSPFVALD